MNHNHWFWCSLLLLYGIFYCLLSHQFSTFF